MTSSVYCPCPRIGRCLGRATAGEVLKRLDSDSILAGELLSCVVADVLETRQ